ncbi:MAG: hypothetical protein CFH44_00013 [Proteobacteria bacterium]|nr:MAG: hypothetical protein CFH44_00013 [Pseudomonadota bacterium]|tara:strand:- start:46 stop:918 length:873 start_codon:yes stop_codon:yes gene_type:complete
MKVALYKNYEHPISVQDAYEIYKKNNEFYKGIYKCPDPNCGISLNMANKNNHLPENQLKKARHFTPYSTSTMKHNKFCKYSNKIIEKLENKTSRLTLHSGKPPITNKDDDYIPERTANTSYSNRKSNPSVSSMKFFFEMHAYTYHNMIEFIRGCNYIIKDYDSDKTFEIEDFFKLLSDNYDILSNLPYFSMFHSRCSIWDNSKDEKPNFRIQIEAPHGYNKNISLKITPDFDDKTFNMLKEYFEIKPPITPKTPKRMGVFVKAILKNINSERFYFSNIKFIHISHLEKQK